MPLVLKKKPVEAKKPAKVAKLTGKITSASIAHKAEGLKESATVKVFDIPIVALVDHKDNPNVQTEKVHDELIDRIRRDGVDEPIIVIPYVDKGKPVQGKYMIVSGHHRKKGAQAAGLAVVPAIIREGWSQDQADIELIARNSLSGNMDPFRFTELFDKLSKRYDPATLQKMLGLTEKKAFNALYKRVADSLPPKQKKKLEDAKETIKSIDDLTGILNKIFEEHGSELDWGFMVFSMGGKKHHYIKISSGTEKAIESLKAKLEEADIQADDFFSALLADKTAIGNVTERLINAST